MKKHPDTDSHTLFFIPPKLGDDSKQIIISKILLYTLMYLTQDMDEGAGFNGDNCLTSNYQ